MSDTILSALTTSTATPGNFNPSGDKFEVRLYIPVESHSVTFQEQPIAIDAPVNKPTGILPEPAHGTSEGGSNADTDFQWDPSVTESPAATTDNSTLVSESEGGFRNTAFAYGKYTMNISMQGTVQQVTVQDGNNSRGLLEQDATDATGKVLHETDANGNFIHDEYMEDADTVGMTGDQLRNEILRLAARQHEFGLQKDGTANATLYYMYPHWRGQDNPHWFRGIITNFSVNDEVGMREGYDFSLTWTIANPRPDS